MWAASMRTCKGPLIKGCHPWSLRKCRRRAMRPPPDVRDKVCAFRQRERLVRRQGLELLPSRSRRAGKLEPIKHRGPAMTVPRRQQALQVVLMPLLYSIKCECCQRKSGTHPLQSCSTVGLVVL